MGRATRAALLGAALMLAGCGGTREDGNRYDLMERSERVAPARPETVGEGAANPTGGPTSRQGKPPEQGGARPGIIR